MTLIFDAIGAFIVGFATATTGKAPKPDPDAIAIPPEPDEAAYWKSQHDHMAATLEVERAHTAGIEGRCARLEAQIAHLALERDRTRAECDAMRALLGPPWSLRAMPQIRSTGEPAADRAVYSMLAPGSIVEIGPHGRPANQPARQGLAAFCNCVPARHDMLTGVVRNDG